MKGEVREAGLQDSWLLIPVLPVTVVGTSVNLFVDL